MSDRPTLPPEDDRDFTQLTGAFDRPVAPSPAFAERLKRQVVDAQQEQGATDMRAHTASEPRVSRMTDSRVIPMPPTRLSGGGIMELVAAAVLVFALVSSGFYLYRIQNGTTPRDPDGQRLAATTPLATPTSVATERDVARGGSFGTEASLDPTYPDSALPIGSLARAWRQKVSAPKWMMPYGNVIAVLGTSELAVYDDQTGEELWSQPVSDALRDRLTEDPGNPEFILAMHAGPMALPWIEGETLYITTPSELVGLNLMTGDETFRAPHHAGDPGVAGSDGKLPAGLAIADGVAYVQAWSDVSDDVPVSAIDLTSGNILWSTPLQGPPEGYLSVAGGLVILPVRVEDGDRITALNAANGSVAWTVEASLMDEDQGRLDGTTLFITDGVIVQTRMATTGQEEPSSDPADALRIAAYELDTGEVLWTSRSDDPSWGLDPDAINGCGFFPRVSGDALLIPCWEQDMSSMSIVSLPIDGEGTAETPEVLSKLPGAMSMGFVAFDNRWIFGADDEIVQVDLATGTITPMGSMGGDVCDQRAFPTSNGLACLTTDGLGTYAIQVFAPEPDVPDIPQASPVTSDPNHTGAWPAEFDLSRPLVAQPIDGYQSYAASGVVVGDVLIAENKAFTVEDPPSFSGTGIYAQDLRTGEILWRNADHIHQRYTADDSGVYGLPQPMTNNQYLIALDLETGKERWRSEPMSDFSTYPEDAPFLHANTPIAIDGTVYVPFVDGSVLAFDGESGEIVWRSTPESIADIDDVHGHASIAGTSERVYAAGGANVIAVLDRESGALIQEITVEDVPVDNYRIDVIAGESHVLVRASSLGSGDTGDKLIAVDPDTGDEMWRQDTGVIVSNVLVNPTTVGVMHTDYDPANLIERVVLNEELEGTTTLSLFDIDTGESVEVPEGVFTPIDGVWSGALAASGETICVAYTTVTCFDQQATIVGFDGFESEAVTAIGQELVFWDDRLVILDPREPIHIVTGP